MNTNCGCVTRQGWLRPCINHRREIAKLIADAPGNGDEFFTTAMGKSLDRQALNNELNLELM